MSRRVTKSEQVTVIPATTESIEAGLRDFLLKSGAGSMLCEASTGSNKRNSFSAESPSLPPILKEVLAPMHSSTADGSQHSDSNHEQARLMESLASEVVRHQNRNRGSQKLVSGTQFRMPQKEPIVCVQCDSLDKQLKKSKETNRVLRLQISRLEEKMHDMRKSRPEVENGHISNAIENDSIHDEYRLLSRRYDASEAELAALKKKLIDLDQEKVRVDCLLLTALTDNNDLKTEFDKFKDSIKAIQIDKDALERELNGERTALAHEKESHARYIAQSHLDLERSRATCQSLSEELQVARGSLDAKTSDSMAMERTIQAQGIQIRSLEVDRDKLKERLNQINEEASKAQSQSTAANNQAMDLADALRAAEALAQELQTSSNVAREECALANAEIKKLRIDNRQGELKQMELIRRMTADSESTQKALEKAITASVRLCVVAPTVNVHIPDKKMNLKSSVSDVTLREFLSKEVLEKYTFLFKQRQENASPEEGRSIQQWVEQMLRNMQTAIEQHVYKAIEGSM